MGALVHPLRLPAPAGLLLVPGLALLLAEPALWLARTWVDPAYDSQGALVALAAALVVMRSASSGPAPALSRRDRRLALALLLATACVRLLGRLLAVHVVGALALVLDVVALGLLLRLHGRPWAVRPASLGLLFAFALPVEHVLQRALGYPLRLAGAALSEAALAPFFPTLTREGTLLVDGALRLHVDLPCSGAQGLMLTGALAAALSCRLELSWRRALAGGLAVAAGALVTNALRVALLFVGARAGLPVHDEPWHSGIGLVCLASGALPLVLLAARARPLAPSRPEPGALASRPAPARAALAAGFSVLAAAVSLAPGRPLDVSRTDESMRLPDHVDGFETVVLPLSDLERAYFRAYGGAADKRAYIDARGAAHVAVLVRTTSPLRHLHGPEACLAGAGHEVTRLGVRRGLVPTVVYRTVAPDGRRSLVEAAFVSERGETASSVSEVAWRWLSAPGTAWMLVERIHPEGACAPEAGGFSPCERLERALLEGAALFSNPQEQQR